MTYDTCTFRTSCINMIHVDSLSINQVSIELAIAEHGNGMIVLINNARLLRLDSNTIRTDYNTCRSQILNQLREVTDRRTHISSSNETNNLRLTSCLWLAANPYNTLRTMSSHSIPPFLIISIPCLLSQQPFELFPLRECATLALPYTLQYTPYACCHPRK